MYFRVSHLEAPPGDDFQSSESSAEACYIDPASTTMVQTGLENYPSLSADTYFDLSKWYVPIAAGLADCSCASLVEPKSRVDSGFFELRNRFAEYLRAAIRIGAADLELSLSVLVKGARGSGKHTLARSVAQQCGFHLLALDCYDLLGETDVKTEGNLLARVERAAACTPCMLVLRHIEALARKSQAVETGQEPTIAATLQEAIRIASYAWKKTGYPLVVVGTASDADKVPVSVLGCFKEELAIEAPAETDRLAILQNLLYADALAPDVSVKSIAVQTAALVAGDLVDLVTRVRMTAMDRLLKAG